MSIFWVFYNFDIICPNSSTLHVNNHFWKEHGCILLDLSFLSIRKYYEITVLERQGHLSRQWSLHGLYSARRIYHIPCLNILYAAIYSITANRKTLLSQSPVFTFSSCIQLYTERNFLKLQQLFISFFFAPKWGSA